MATSMSSPLPPACTTLTPSARPVGDTFPGLALEDHGYRLGDPSCSNGCSHLLHERSGRSCSVPPPAARTGSDDVGCVNEKHRFGLILLRRGSHLWVCISVADSNFARGRGLAANDDSC